MVERGRVENGGGGGGVSEGSEGRRGTGASTLRSRRYETRRAGAREVVDSVGRGASVGRGGGRERAREGDRFGTPFAARRSRGPEGVWGRGRRSDRARAGRTGTLLAVAERGVEDADVVLVVDPARDVLRPGRADDVRVRGRLRGARHRAAATRREAGPRRPGGARDRASRPERGRRDRARRARHRGPGSTGWDESTDARRRHEGRARVWRPRARRDETRSRSPAGARRSQDGAPPHPISKTKDRRRSTIGVQNER